METKKDCAEYLLSHAENCSKRYIDDESFVLKLMDMPIYKLIFFRKRIIINHIKKMLEKYQF